MSYNPDRPYKVVYTNPRRRTTPDLSVRDQRSDSTRGYATKTTYNVNDTQIRKADVVIIDQPRHNHHRSYSTQSSRPLVEYEVLKPDRSGVYVIEADIDQRRDRRKSSYPNQRYDDNRRSSTFYERPSDDRRRSSNFTVMTTATSHSRPNDERRRSNTFSNSGNYGNYDNSKTLALTESMAAIKVMEEPDEEYDRQRGRTKTETSSKTRLRSALRTNHSRSPETVNRRNRSQSVGFYNDQIAHHDVSESRHERPGAEANVAGRHLIQRGGGGGGSREDDASESAETDRSRRKSRRYSPQRGGSVIDEPDVDDEGFRKRSWSRRRKGGDRDREQRKEKNYYYEEEERVERRRR